MDRDDTRINAVLRELADLGLRIGERAGELARLAADCHRVSASDSVSDSGTATVTATAPDNGTACIAARAADLAAGAAALVVDGHGVGNRQAGRVLPQSAPVPRRVQTMPLEQKTRPSGHRRSRGARASRLRPRPDGHDEHVRPSVVPRQSPIDTVIAKVSTKASKKASEKPNQRRVRAGRIRMHGPAVVSSLIHLVVLIGLALMYINVEAKPVRVAITLGEATVLEEPALEAFSLLPPDPTQQPDIPTEPDPLTLDSQAADDALPSGELSTDLPLADTALADTSLAETAGAAEAAAFDPGDMAAMLADVVGGGQRGEGQKGEGQSGGKLAGGQAAGPAAANFFGRAGQGRSVCFICDNSNSHRDGSFHVVLDELARAVDLLRPEQSFFVIFTSDAAYPLFHPVAVDTLQPATVENKRKLRAWLETVEMCRGGQGIHDAMSMAGSLGADAIYLLSDGEFAASVVERLRVADIGRSVVHTFGVQQRVIDQRTGLVDPDGLREQQGRNLNLVTIATAHGGTFTPVIVPAPVAALERLRPIPRNRSRGAIWGVRL